MSPEQAAAKHSEVGPTSDIYSLGATLYELLTGQIPFLGNSSAEVIEQVKSGRIRPPRQVNPGVPLALEAICLKAMHKEPANRYQTAAELAKDIENYLDDQPVSTYTEPLFDQVRRFARRHRALVSTAIGALLVSLIGFAIATPILTAALRDSRLARQAESEARDAESQRANELAHALYRNQFQEAVAWQSLDSQRSRRLLNASDADLRGVEWSLLNAQLDSRARLIAVPSLQHYERVSRFTLSPDRSLAAVIGHPDHLAVHEVVSGKVVWHPDVGWADGNSEQAIISPDNRFLAVMVPTHLEETLYARTTVIVLDLSTKSELWRKSWEHTEQRESNVLAWDTEGNQPVRRTRTTRERIEYWNSMAFSEQSGSLTFVRSQLEQNSMTLVFDQYDSATGERLASESSDPMTIYRDMTLSTDGRWLAVPNQEWLQILDTTSGEIVSQWKHDQPIISTQVGARLPVRKFSSDGKLFAMLDPQLHLRNQSNSPISLNKPVVRVWDTQTGDLIQTLRLHDAFPDVNFIEYLPDNNRLILVGHEQVEIWNVTEGERLQKMLLPPQKRFELPIDPKTIMGIELISDHQIWCLIEDGSVSELDLESTPSIKRWNSPDVAKKLALAGDNSSLVVLQDRNGRIVVANADTNETIREVGMETTDVSQMDASFAVDTKCELLAVVNSSGLRVEELQTGLLRFEVESIEWQKSRSETVVATVHGPVAFSKDGTTLFIAASDDSLPTVDPAP
jgi:WD40 repeat protein